MSSGFVHRHVIACERESVEKDSARHLATAQCCRIADTEYTIK